VFHPVIFHQLELSGFQNTAFVEVLAASSISHLVLGMALIRVNTQKNIDLTLYMNGASGYRSDQIVARHFC